MSTQPPSKRRSPLRRLLAAAGALALGSALVTSAAGTAAAAPVPAFDPDGTGSLTVHKFEQPAAATGLPNDGRELSDAELAGLEPLAGVSFDIAQADIDLSDPDSWQGLDALTVAEAEAAGAGPSAAGTITTGAEGSGSLADLPVGVYIVTETTAGDNAITTPADPFLVSIPLAFEGQWLYDVHVYPKNTVSDAPVKAVQDGDANILGDTVTWTIDSSVPAVAGGTTLPSYVIADTLDSRLTYTGATIASPDVDLVPADYTIAAGPSFSLAFTEAGLTKLSANPGAVLTTTISTTVNSIGDGAITNTASLTVGGAVTPSNTVVSSWGALTISKVAAENTDQGLPGAEFDVFSTTPTGEQGELVTSVVTGDGGVVTLPGLSAGTYQLVETTAPNGYVLDPTPITVTVTEGSTADATVQQVTNAQVPAFSLPLTGSTGIWLFIAVGLALVGTGAALTVARKRRQSA